MKWLAVGGLGGLLMSIALIFGEGYRKSRFLSFLNPWADPSGAGYQLIQGYIALGSGGWFGVGLGASRQKWGYVPNAHTDFIFAILGEELGLVGEFVVLALFGRPRLRGHPHRRAGARHVRPAAGGRHHGVVRAAGDREPRRRDRPAADHRRAAAVRVVRRLGARGHARVGSACCASIARAGGGGEREAARSPEGLAMKVVIAGGGTAGHVFPAVALAQELAAGGHHVAFLGTEDGLEARLVPEAGLRVHADRGRAARRAAPPSRRCARR